MRVYARSGQTATYRRFTLSTVGNDVVTELCLIFVYGKNYLSIKQSQTKGLPAHYQTVVPAWQLSAFWSDF